MATRKVAQPEVAPPPPNPRTKAEWIPRMDEARAKITELEALVVAAKENLDEMVRLHNNSPAA